MIYAKALVISKIVPIIEALTDLQNEIGMDLTYSGKEEDIEFISDATSILESIIIKSE